MLSFIIKLEQFWVKRCTISNNGRGFPGGSVVKDPPANAGNTGLTSGLGRSHMPAEQLSPCAATTEPEYTNTEVLAPWTTCSTTREATAMRSLYPAKKSSPRSLRLEKSPAATKAQQGQKQINKIIFENCLKKLLWQHNRLKLGLSWSNPGAWSPSLW